MPEIAAESEKTRPATADIWEQIDAENEAERQALGQDEEAKKQAELEQQEAKKALEAERQQKREERKSRAKKRSWSTDAAADTHSAEDDDWLKAWREGGEG